MNKRPRPQKVDSHLLKLVIDGIIERGCNKELNNEDYEDIYLGMQWLVSNRLLHELLDEETVNE